MLIKAIPACLRRLVTLALLMAAGGVQAAMPAGSSRSDSYNRQTDDLWLTPQDTAATRPERKIPGFWHRSPHEAAPDRQLTHARGLERAGKLRAAARACDALVRYWGDAPEAVTAQRGKARLLEKRRKYAKAFEEYSYLLHYYADRFPASDALEHMFAIANHYRGKGSEERALKMFKQIAELAPQWQRTPAALLQAGLLQVDANDLVEATATFERITTDHAGSDEARDAAAQAAMCRYRLARRYPDDDAINLRAMSSLTVALRDYPEHPERARLQSAFDELQASRTERHYRAAAFYDSPRHPPSAAIAAYGEFLRRFPNAPQADKARQRLDELAAVEGGKSTDPQGEPTP
ncbi:MAG: hypothetical protein PHR35_09040 [Kiritimatiellae bacterium]|nr:hypothetical protein [Kiritimatiellia bacterium]